MVSRISLQARASRFEFRYINPLGAKLHKTVQDRVTNRRITSVMPRACAAGLLEVLGQVDQSGTPVDIEPADSSTASPTWRRYIVQQGQIFLDSLF